MTLSVQAAQNNLYVGGEGRAGEGRYSRAGWVEQGLLHERGNSAKATGRDWLYLVASSHGGMDRIDNCCKYNATNWSRMSVRVRKPKMFVLFFLVPASWGYNNLCVVLSHSLTDRLDLEWVGRGYRYKCGKFDYKREDRLGSSEGLKWVKHRELWGPRPGLGRSQLRRLNRVVIGGRMVIWDGNISKRLTCIEK